VSSNLTGTTVNDEKINEEEKELEYEVYDTWNKKIVYIGNEEACINYIRGNNVYQMNYSKLEMQLKKWKQ
jgi:hypothetical protein